MCLCRAVVFTRRHPQPFSLCCCCYYYYYLNQGLSLNLELTILAGVLDLPVSSQAPEVVFVQH